MAALLIGAVLGGGTVAGLAALASFGDGHRHGGPFVERAENRGDRGWPGDGDRGRHGDRGPGDGDRSWPGDRGPRGEQGPRGDQDGPDAGPPS